MSKQDGLLALLVTFIWGINFSVIKLGLGTMDPFLLASLRFLLTAIPLVFFLPKPDIKFIWIAVYGLLFGVGLWGMVNLGIRLGATPGVASLLLQMSAYFTIIFGYFFFSEKLNTYQVVAMLISLSGLVILILSNEKSSDLFALFLVIVGAFSMGLSNVMIKKLSPKNVFSFMAWSSLFSPIPLLLLAFLSDSQFSLHSALSRIDSWAIFSILFQVYITTLFAYWVWNNLLKKYPISTVAPISLLVPIFGFMGSAVIFNEALTAIKLVSSGLILLGLVIFVLRNNASTQK
ncbi:MAG: EamA family transporter [Cocleimonas sp.]